LKTERSVVNPGGKNKYERWARIAMESAKQSHRRGVMRIENLTEVKQLVAQEVENTAGAVFYLSTDLDAVLLTDALARLDPSRERLLLIGPEGGWTDTEINLFEDSGARGVKLTSTILRVETATIAGATIALLLSAAPTPRDNAGSSTASPVRHAPS
jgi:16S rRNA (uracil1498-N3)-methyltransferase